MTAENPPPSSRRRGAGLILLLLVLLGAAGALLPAWVVMRPFQSQTPGQLALAQALRGPARWGVPILALLAALLAAVRFARTRGWWRKAALVSAPLALLPFAVLAWREPAEWMFRPIGEPRYARAGEAGFLAGEDRVLGVAREEDAAAYPVRQLAYHHLVEDDLAGVPIIATF